MAGLIRCRGQGVTGAGASTRRLKNEPVPAPKKQPVRTVLRACWRRPLALPPVREVGCISNAPRWTPNCVREGVFFSKLVFEKAWGEDTSFKWFLAVCLVLWSIDLVRCGKGLVGRGMCRPSPALRTALYSAQRANLRVSLQPSSEVVLLQMSFSRSLDSCAVKHGPANSLNRTRFSHRPRE